MDTADLPSRNQVAAAFPQLEIMELIGRGGMGIVFKARQPHLDRWVALKLLPEKLARDPLFAERFHREGRVLARLSHPNIVTVHDFGRTQDFYFLMMEFVDGVNLRQAMRVGRFSPAEALAVVPRICEALQYAHDQGVLHRDIKPENILLDGKGRVKIADFGIAKLAHEQAESMMLTGTGSALGTPHYMAPEQLERPSEVDHRADIYSLGVVFYEMLTGELPIGRFAPPSASTPVGTAVDDIVFRALEKDRDKRFQSAGEVKTNVEQIATTGVTPATASRRRRVALGWAVMAAAAVVVVLALGTWRWRVGLSARELVSMGPGKLASAQHEPRVRFTITSVDLRKDSDGNWLGFDYVDDDHGSAQRAFRYDAAVAGFVGRTRATSFEVPFRDGSPGVRHQRIEFQLPLNVAPADLLNLEQGTRTNWVRRTVVTRPGEEHMLFNLNLAQRGTLTGWMGAVSTTATAAAQRNDEADALAIRDAKNRQRNIEAAYRQGSATMEDLLKAQRDAAVAEARGDELAATRAYLGFMVGMLAEARQKNDIPLTLRMELQKAQAEHRLAVLEAKGDPERLVMADVAFWKAAVAHAQQQHEAGVISAEDLQRKELELEAFARTAMERVSSNHSHSANR
jgi:tRNA A-37 threonylcarbamoyl transferase component Bud32